MTIGKMAGGVYSRFVWGSVLVGAFGHCPGARLCRRPAAAASQGWARWEKPDAPDFPTRCGWSWDDTAAVRPSARFLTATSVASETMPALVGNQSVLLPSCGNQPKLCTGSPRPKPPPPTTLWRNAPGLTEANAKFKPPAGRAICCRVCCRGRSTSRRIEQCPRIQTQSAI
jgi:hypothetical protein